MPAVLIDFDADIQESNSCQTKRAREREKILIDVEAANEESAYDNFQEHNYSQSV